jgi:hypothetical protein
MQHQPESSLPPIQQRVIQAIEGASLEQQMAALGWALLFLFSTEAEAPLKSFDDFVGGLRAVLKSVEN